MAEKHKNTYDLEKIKIAFNDPGNFNRTRVARLGSQGLEMTDDEVIEVIRALHYPADFDKSMTSTADHTVWQDVYKPVWKGRKLYVKFTVNDRGAFLLISFKEGT